MITIEPRDDVLLPGLSTQVVVVPHELDLGVVGVRARVPEEDFAHPARDHLQ
jgi:hypothetical protein